MEECHLNPAKSEEKIYRCIPRGQLALPGGPVPVFSNRDQYVENYERISADHVAHMQTTGCNPFIPEPLWTESERLTADQLRRYGTKGSRVLDVGCGLGRLLTQFPEFLRYGMDISSGYLEYAQRAGIDVCLSRIEDMPYTDGLFDLVICTDVLEHVFDMHAACTQLIRVVRNDGLLVVRVPYRENLACYLAPSLPYEFVHVRNFDEDSLTLLFEKIYRCKVIDMIKGPFLWPWVLPKCRLPLRGLGLMHRTVARFTRLAGQSVQKAFLEWAFDPPEINIVVRVKKDL